MRIPVEMRKKMVAAVERGEAIASVARRFEVSERGVRKLVCACRERGTFEPMTPGPKGPIKLTPEDDAIMRRLVREDPGITLKQIMTQLTVNVAESTVCRRLQALGMSFKKSR
jgi:transposase